MALRAFYPNYRADSLFRNTNTRVRFSREREERDKRRRRRGRRWIERSEERAFQQKD